MSADPNDKYLKIETVISMNCRTLLILHNDHKKRINNRNPFKIEN